MKVVIVTTASGENFSIEAGIADGQMNFDHHGQYECNPAPCADDRIPTIGTDDVVEITHIDADTYVGLLRMAGKKLPEVNLGLMAEIDLNGSSACSDKFDTTLSYMVGIGQIARELKFPRASDKDPVDVTDVVEAIMALTTEEIIATGKEATQRSEASYENCRKAVSGVVGYWVIGSDDPLDPSRPYEDGIEVVVVHRMHYKAISIYCSPNSDHAFGGQEIAGIVFAGHPKAAGSPRGVEFTHEDGKRVFEALKKEI